MQHSKFPKSESYHTRNLTGGSHSSTEKRDSIESHRASQAAQQQRIRLLCKTWAQSLGWADPLEEGMATQYSCLESPMDWRAWQVTVQRVAKNQTWLKQLGTHEVLDVLHVKIRKLNISEHSTQKKLEMRTQPHDIKEKNENKEKLTNP